MATETKTFYPGAYDTSDYAFQSISNATNPVGKGSSNNSSATIHAKTGDNALTYTFWPFDLSSIPADAVINSVGCKAKLYVESTIGIASLDVQLFSGVTAKGNITDAKKTSATVVTLSTGTWTRSELSNCRLKIRLSRSTTQDTATRRIYFYGADLAVTYTYQNEKFMLKLGGKYNDIARVFKKVSGIWVEQTDLANVIEDEVRYQNGGEYIAPVKPAAVTITGSGNATYCYATINGTKYSGAASNIEVMPGDVITFGVYGYSSTYYGEVAVGQPIASPVLTVTNRTTQTYNWTVPDGVKTISIAMTYTSSTNQRNGRIVVTTS